MTLNQSRAREWLVAVGVGAVLVCLMTWPTAPGLLSYGRLDTADGRFSIWNVGWIGHALTTSDTLLDANIFYPHLGTLAYSELNLVAGLLGLPAFVATGSALGATNTAILVGLLGSFLATWALVRRLTGSPVAGLVSATGFTFLPFVQAHTAHIQLLMTFGMPLVLLAFHSLRDRMSVVSAAGLGLALAIAGLGCAYYGIFAGLTLGLVALLLARRDRAYWLALAGAALVTVAIVAPIFIPYQRARAAVAAPPWSMDEIRAWSATPASYLSSPSYVHEEWIGLPGAIESTFPGFVLIALAVIGVISSFRVDKPCERRLVLTYVAVTGLAFWASFGPGAFLWAAVLKVIPTAGLLRAPVRWGVVVGLGLAVLAGFGVKFVAQRRPTAALFLLPVLAFELATLPWPLVKAGPVAAAHDLLAQMPRGPVVEFLFMYRPKDFLNHTTYMYDSTSHWQPLVNGYSDVTPPDFPELASKINDFPDADTFATMRRLGVRYVIWHMDEYDPEARRKIEARLLPYAPYLRRVTAAQDVWLYEIVGWPPGRP